MNVTVDLQIAVEDDDHPPPSQLEQWITAAIGDRRDCSELTVRIVDEAEITDLNSRYRHKHQPTNVLSFAADLPPMVDLPLLGDIVICAPVIAREAKEQHKKPVDHWAHMLVHGTLHLLGYDHIDEGEAQLMEALEIDILASLGIANPYLSQPSTTATNTSAVNL